jgi:hypothetical protein
MRIRRFGSTAQAGAEEQGETGEYEQDGENFLLHVASPGQFECVMTQCLFNDAAARWLTEVRFVREAG